MSGREHTAFCLCASSFNSLSNSFIDFFSALSICLLCHGCFKEVTAMAFELLYKYVTERYQSWHTYPLHFNFYVGELQDLSVFTFRLDLSILFLILVCLWEFH